MVEHSVTILLPHPYITSTAIFEYDVVVVIGLELPFVKFLVFFQELAGLNGIRSQHDNLAPAHIGHDERIFFVRVCFNQTVKIV